MLNGRKRLSKAEVEALPSRTLAEKRTVFMYVGQTTALLMAVVLGRVAVVRGPAIGAGTEEGAEAGSEWLPVSSMD